MEHQAMRRDGVQLGNGWVITLRDLGIDPRDVLRRAQLPEDLVTRPETRLPSQDYFRLWEAMESESGDPLLGLHIGQRISAEAFHPAIFAGLCSPDLVEAARRIALYKRLVGPMVLEVEESPQGVYIEVRWDDPTAEVPQGLAALELVIFTRIARLATRRELSPIRVESARQLPGHSEYEAWFGTKLELGNRHGVTFSSEDARLPFLTANNALWGAFEPELRRRLAQLEASASLEEKVRAVLIESLPAGDSNIQDVAKRLGVGERSLQRHLKAEGTSFKRVVNHTRERLAYHYLRGSDLSYAEIAFLIGFEEPSSFFRAFREWTGRTPDSVRSQSEH